MKIPSLKVVALFLLVLLLSAGGIMIFRQNWLLVVGITILVILVLLIILMYKKMMEIKKANEIEQSINTQSNNQIQNLSPEKRKEIERLRKQLETAINSLKNSKLGNGKSGKAALYALPWYMIIGPSAAGKTTAIQNSGLEFPFGREGFRGVGGTRNCDWFFSTKGIFLDTAGRYVTQQDDRVEWLAFLDVLKKNRRKKPINGVIAVLNIDEIINSRKDNLSEHAQNIRQRIDELVQNLGINFPVYFVFTKLDLVQGFVEYFGDFSETERSQIWGATLPNQQLKDLDVKSIFDTEFDKLSNKLFEIRTSRLNNPLKREQRRKVFLFPLQFQSLKQKLSYLITEVFQNNPYQDNPVFRGFYFTSGTQEGVPLDLAIKIIAKQFDLPETVYENAEEVVEAKHYFIKDLLNEVVIGDQNFQAGQTTGHLSKVKKSRLIAITCSIAFLLLFSSFSYISYRRSKTALDNITNTTTVFSGINWNGDLFKNFNKSENFRLVLTSVQNGEAVNSFVKLGMDKTSRTKDLLEKLYITKTAGFFNDNIYREIEKVLNNYVDGKEYSSEQIYTYLKAYLLLGNERARLDTTEYSFLERVFLNILVTKYVSPNMFSSSSEKDSLKYLFKNYVTYITDKLRNKDVYSASNDNVVIKLVRSRVQYRPGPENVYTSIKQNADHLYFNNNLNLQEIIGGRYSDLIKSDFQIPYIFTADAWKNYVQKTIADESANPGKNDWVMGNSLIQNSYKNLTGDEIKNELLLMYLNDYKQTWLQFLQSIKYTGFETVPLAANNMQVLSDPVNSPLLVIMKTFATQLQVITEIVQPPDTMKVKTVSMNRTLLNSFDLSDINNYKTLILASDGSLSKDMNAIAAQYGILSGVLDKIKDEQGSVKDYAIKLLNQRAVEFPAALQSIKGTLYRFSSLQDIFCEPVNLTWNAMLSEASQYLNTEWKSKVADIFNKSMANSFPFKNTNREVPFQDFKDFFKPQDGILWSFVNNELSPFFNVERWKANQWENGGLNISNEMVSALKKAMEISSALFKNGELNVSFRLKPQLPESRLINNQKPVIEQVYISLDNVENYYRMGASFWNEYSWPGNKGVPGARMNISIHGYGTSETLSYDGDWAMFKLFQTASVSTGETSSQYVFNWLFRKDNDYDVTVTYLLNSGSSKNPFSPNFFTSFRLPDKIN